MSDHLTPAELEQMRADAARLQAWQERLYSPGWAIRVPAHVLRLLASLESLPGRLAAAVREDAARVEAEGSPAMAMGMRRAAEVVEAGG